MRAAQAVSLALPSVLALATGQAGAQMHQDPTRFSFEVSREALLMDGDMGRSGWPVRLATPSDEGQFEVAVSKDAAPVMSPHCRNQYLIIRMPASVGEDPATQASVERKREEYAVLLAAYNAGRPIRFEVFAGPYGKRLPDGRVELTGCNLFFTEPTAPGR